MSTETHRILFFMDQVQDLDLALPILKKAVKDPRLSVSVCITERLHRSSARVRKALASLSLQPIIANRLKVIFGTAPDLSGFNALFTVSESSARPHRAAHYLTRRANSQGLETFTIQHGFDNIGLTYSDAEYPILSVRIASQTIFTWGKPETYHPTIHQGTRARCVPVGYPKETGELPVPDLPKGSRVVGVFENLHWSRYDAAYRSRFLADLKKAITEFPGITFILKPHHDRRWLSAQRRQFSRFSNVIFADPKDPAWEPFTAGSILKVCGAVITTPSTVALDAAHAGLPAAVAAYGTDTERYQPLRKLDSYADWARFLNAAFAGADREELTALSGLFFERSAVGGAAVERILKAFHCSEPSASEFLVKDKVEEPKEKAPVKAAEYFFDLMYWFRYMKIDATYFSLSVVCSVFSVFFNLLGLRLFIPLLQGLLKGDFTKIHDKFGLMKHAEAAFPSVFSHPHATLFLILGIIMTSFLLKSVADYISNLFVGLQVRKADSRIRQLLFGRYLGMGKLFFDVTNVANIHYMIANTATGVSNQIRTLKTTLTQMLALAGYAGLMLWISWKMTLITLLVLPVQHLVTTQLVERIKRQSSLYETARVGFSETVFNVFSCITLVKAYASEEREKQQLHESSQKEIELSYQMQKKQLLIKPVQEINTMLSLVVIVLLMSWMMNSDPAQAAPSYLVFFFLVRRAMPCFGSLADLRLSMANSHGIFERLRAVTTEGEQPTVRAGRKIFPGLKKQIRFSGLNFRYRESIPVLNDLSFTVPQGKMTAIVGTTAAGKSTIVQLLMRFYECPAGTIFLDDTDIREYSLKSIADRIAYVGQEPQLFNATLRDNIAYGLERKVSDAEILDAVRMAQLGDLVNKLTEGLDTMLGDRGVRLSGGERQRVAIARAFLKNADILILDEATSALDTQTEKKIQQAIESVVRGRTSIVIAHRLSTIVNADNILVLEHGRVVEEGPLKELLAREGKFYEFWNNQSFSSGQSPAFAPGRNVPSKPYKIFIGWDSGEQDAYEVCARSLLRHSSVPLDIVPLKQADLRKAGLYWRSDDPLASTEFTYTRFLAPALTKHRNWALFVDCDFLFTADVAELFAYCDDRYAALCVKHDYRPSETVKMDGRAQSVYPRKNWSSLVLWNCAHPSNASLTPAIVNRESGAYLHRFQWLKDEEIGSIPGEWNWLEGWNKKPAAGLPKAVHYTRGGPWFPNWQDVDYADLWRAEFALIKKSTPGAVLEKDPHHQ